MEPLRIGLIGVGMMGREHVRNIKLFPDARITAICDPVAEQRALTRETLGPAADGVADFETVEALVADAKLDAVLVVSPNHTHRRVLESLFDTQWAILCEKPLCTTVDDARWAAEKAARRRAVFWTGMEYRFMPPVAEEHFPGGLIERFAGTVAEALMRMLVWLSPVTVRAGEPVVIELREGR